MTTANKISHGIKLDTLPDVCCAGIRMRRLFGGVCKRNRRAGWFSQNGLPAFSAARRKLSSPNSFPETLADLQRFSALGKPGVRSAIVFTLRRAGGFRLRGPLAIPFQNDDQ
jgi:hypothetical protein